MIFTHIPTIKMSYITYLGSSALSDFRRRALAGQLHVKDVRAQWVHFVALHGDDAAKDYSQEDLNELLTYGDEYLEDEEEYGENTTTWFVQPRKGTISPWSSKATSIAEVCGFGHIVKRIERGTIFKITSDEDFDVEKAKKQLYDKMTQDLSTSMPDLETMFGERTPTPTVRNLQGASSPSCVIQTCVHLKTRLITHFSSICRRSLIYSLKAANPKKFSGRLIRIWDWRSTIQRLNIWSPSSQATADWGGLPSMWSCTCLLRSIQVFLETHYYLVMNAELSEHCRHKQFNASYTIDGVKKDLSLFSMIRNTNQKSPRYVYVIS